MTRRQLILGWVLVALHLILLPLFFVYINRFLSRNLTLAEINIAVFTTVFVLSVLIFHSYLRKNLQTFKADLPKCLLSSLIGFGIYFVGNVAVSILISYLAPDFANVNDAAIADMSQDHFPLMWVATVLLVPVSEECMYRGLLFQGLYRKGRVLAYVVSVLAFAAIHVVGYIGTTDALTLLLCLLQYFPAGFALAWAYEKADSIWASILIHMFVNMIGMTAMR